MANQARILLNTPQAPGSVRPAEEIQPALQARRRQLIRLYLTAIILLSMMFTLYVWQSTKMIEVKLRIKKDISNIENGNSDLRAEISKLQSLNRIESVARNELGMIIPKNLIYIDMPEQFK
jgi:cell division protein FtsL